MEGLRHESNSLLFDEVLELLDGLGNCALGFIPNSNRIIFETRRNSVLGPELEHLCLALAQTVHGERLALVDLIKHIFEGSLELHVEAKYFVVGEAEVDVFLLAASLLLDKLLDVLLKNQLLVSEFGNYDIFAWLGLRLRKLSRSHWGRKLLISKRLVRRFSLHARLHDAAYCCCVLTVQLVLCILRASD